MSAEEFDTADLPIGTILPFADDMQIPHGWIKFEGQRLHRKDYRELYDRLWSAPAQVRSMWIEMGGKITGTELVLPNVDEKRTRDLVFGNQARPKVKLTLAIKAKRPVTSDASTTG